MKVIYSCELSRDRAGSEADAARSPSSSWLPFAVVALAAVAALWWSTPASADGHGIRRFHGLGEGRGYCHERGVKRFHGLGEQPCYRNPVYYATPDGLGIYYGYPFPTQPWPPRQAAPGPPVEPARARVATRVEHVTTPMTDAARADRGWMAIGAGAPRTALREFAIVALRRPDDAAPRIGYALAASMLHRHDDAAWSLRLAVQRSAAAVRNLPVDPAVADVVRILADYYATDGADDTVLVRATLHVLLDEDAAARAVLGALDPTKDDAATAALRVELFDER